MFKLKRYFLLTGGAAFLGFVSFFLYGFYNQDVSKLEEIGERENLILASFLGDLLKPQIEGLIALKSKDRDSLLNSQLRLEIDKILNDYSKKRAILKVKIFDTEGMTIYSINPSETGAVKNSTGIKNAIEHTAATSEMGFKSSFVTLAGSLNNRDIVETYIPVIVDDQFLAIFELYSDVTAMVQASRKGFYLDVFVFLMSFLGFFGLLYLLARHADRLIKNQYQALARANEKLLDSKKNLDQLVEERTRELSDTVNMLDLEIIERQLAEEQLRQLSVAVEQSPTAILITDPEGLIEYVNPKFTDITGWESDEVAGKSTRFLNSGQTPASKFEDLWQAITKGEVWNGQTYNKKKNGEVYLQDIIISPIFDEDGEIKHFLSISEDITLQKAQEQRIHHLAHHDSLTGLLNRFSLEDRLAQSLALTIRQESQLAVLFLDLDRFKAINDSLGHKAGDDLLIQVAKRLKAICQRKSDVVARIGGDEFVVVLSEIHDPSFAALTAKTIVEVLSLPYSYENEELITTPSIGIALYPSDGDSCDTLMKKADTAMYHVKECGRGHFRFFEEQMNQKVEEKIFLEKALRQALAQDQLALHYQPQVCVTDKTICGVEALLRWQHPDLGFVSPERFIPIAEETGLIIELGQWVIQTALTQLSAWQEQGLPHFRMAINISAKQLESASLVTDVGELLHSLNLDPASVEFEITESIAMANPVKAIEKLRELRKLGIELAIDDFGTGYSSLSYLKMLPVQSLKLDKSFVMNLEHDSNNKAISKAAISLGHDLGFKVVAEGVETQQQQDFLKSIDCDLLQGYYFSKPQTADEIAHFIADFDNAVTDNSRTGKAG